VLGAARAVPSLLGSAVCLQSRPFAKKKAAGKKAKTADKVRAGEAPKQHKGKNKGGGTPGQFVATLEGVRKILPGGRVLLDDVNLRLMAGAKVGVLGANGAGKSSFLKVLGGFDDDVEGSVWSPGSLKVGMLDQEPRLDEERDVISNIMDGVGEQRDLLARFEEVNDALQRGATADGADDLEDIIDEQSRLMARIEELDCWKLELEIKTAVQARHGGLAAASLPRRD